MTMEEKKEGVPEKKVGVQAIGALKKAISIIAAKPIVIVPLIVGMVILRLLGVLVSQWTPDVFDWFWIADLSYLAPEAILVSLMLHAIGAVLVILVHFVSLDMANDAYLNKPPSMVKSASFVVRHLPSLVVVAVVIQALLFPVIFIPIALVVFAVAVADNESIKGTLHKAVGFLRGEIIDVTILSLVWIAWRALLTQINVPFVFSLSFVVDIIVEFAILHLYVSHKSTALPVN